MTNPAMINYSMSDDDQIRLANALFAIALKRLGGFIIVSEADIAAMFTNPATIAQERLGDGRLRIMAKDAPEPTSLRHPEAGPDRLLDNASEVPPYEKGDLEKPKTKKRERKAPAKKAKRKAVKTRGGLTRVTGRGSKKGKR